MCGIAGCFGAKDLKRVNQMLDVLPHRGPDDRELMRQSETNKHE
jgi:asparagine synthase (glutamine-hydrolysing)